MLEVYRDLEPYQSDLVDESRRRTVEPKSEEILDSYGFSYHGILTVPWGRSTLKSIPNELVAVFLGRTITFYTDELTRRAFSRLTREGYEVGELMFPIDRTKVRSRLAATKKYEERGGVTVLDKDIGYTQKTFVIVTEGPLIRMGLFLDYRS